MTSMQRQIIHVDMDAFYASVEMRENPDLRGHAVIVGGRPQARGVVCAASYEARRFGVRSAMPTRQALHLCPEAVLLPPRHTLYAAVSRQLHTVFARYTPQIEPLALDEAFLDVTASRRLFGDGAMIGRALKKEIAEQLGLVASVGVAPNKLIAKLASDYNKPDGFVVVQDNETERFLAPLPINRLWGVGKVMGMTLTRLGIHTIGDLRHYSPQVLRHHLSEHAVHLLQLAHGFDERPVVTERDAKSISHETTFPTDLRKEALLLAWLHELTEQVAARLRHLGLKGRTVQLKLRFADFSTVTRVTTLAQPTDVTREIWQVEKAMLKRLLSTERRAVRLLGCGVSGFNEPLQQLLPLDSTWRRRAREVDRVIDNVNKRFGKRSLWRGYITNELLTTPERSDTGYKR